MTTHELRLATEPFRAIAAGSKTIESRLYDDKRRQIKPGDEILFINRDDETQTLKVRVTGLLRYDTFDELFSRNDPARFGGPDKEWLLSQIRQFYSEEDERADGVVGIEFELS